MVSESPDASNALLFYGRIRIIVVLPTPLRPSKANVSPRITRMNANKIHAVVRGGGRPAHKKRYVAHGDGFRESRNPVASMLISQPAASAIVLMTPPTVVFASSNVTGLSRLTAPNSSLS